MRLIKPVIQETWLEKYVPLKGNGFLDVGANLCTWARWLAPSYRFVHCIEPFRAAIDAAGELPANVTIHPFGAWGKQCNVHFGIDEPGKLLFAQEDIHSWFADIGVHPGDQKSLLLPCGTLDSMVPEKDEITFIKLDVEGAEYQALLGASEIIRQSHPLLIIEIHSRHNTSPIEEILRAENYSTEIVRSPYQPQRQQRQQSEPLEHYWLVCS